MGNEECPLKQMFNYEDCNKDACPVEDPADPDNNPEDPVDPIDQLNALSSQVKETMTSSFGRMNKYAHLVFVPVHKIATRMKRRYQKFDCALKAVATGARSDQVNNCAIVKQSLDDLLAWNAEQLENCGDSSSKIVIKNSHASKNFIRIKIICSTSINDTARSKL